MSLTRYWSIAEGCLYWARGKEHAYMRFEREIWIDTVPPQMTRHSSKPRCLCSLPSPASLLLFFSQFTFVIVSLLYDFSRR